MSFPFYSRLTSKPNRTKDAKEAGNKHVSVTFATGAFDHSEASHTANFTHTRSSSKMRILPFLGKRRKSLATLRPNTIAEDAEEAGGGRGHHKTVSQLANETAARLARSSLAAAGSRSTGNLQLTAFDASPLTLGSGTLYTTPVKNRPLDARHTMFPSGGSKTSTPDKLSLSQNKRSSEKPPTRPSFLSRISSRPALSSRYSSADLKSTSKARGLFRSVERQQATLVTPQRKEIIHPLGLSNGRVLGDDKDFFTSPRVAPTPPNLSFHSPGSSLFDSPLGPSRSTVTLPTQKHSPCLVGTKSTRSPGHVSIKNLNAAQTSTKHSSSPTTVAGPGSLSPETALRSPRRHSVSPQSLTASPDAMKGAVFTSTVSGSPAARPRVSHVRIGTEKVTISVADMLEAELGVEVGDSDSSYYDDSYEEIRRSGSQVSRPGQKHFNEKTSFSDSSDLPPLSSSADDLNLSFKFPKIEGKSERGFVLESQSPLSALMSASASERDDSPSAASSGRVPPATYTETKKKAGHVSAIQSSVNNRQAINQTQGSPAHHGRSVYLHSLGSQSREVDRLDRISERSVSVRQESPCDIDDKDKKVAAAPSRDNSPAITSQLQRALDVQCARFDKLAGHLLQIIQRHQTEKVHLETQIATLQKEARRNEREIKALRKLISHSNNRSSQDGWSSRRLVRVASMQSFLSNISVNDEEVDMSVAVEMLARAGRRSVLLTPDISRDVRASVDLSPGYTPTKAAKSMDLRRSKTMPDLHKAALSVPTPMPTPPLQDTSPDISGLGLGLDFPLPEPLKLLSIASTIMSSAKESSSSIPALTAAPTMASGLSIATEPSINNCTEFINPTINAKSAGVGRGTGRSAREKRMAGEWRPGGLQGLYRPAEQIQQPPSAPPSCAVPALPASASYANNLNKAFVASPFEQVMKSGSPDLDAIYKRLVSNSNGLLG